MVTSLPFHVKPGDEFTINEACIVLGISRNTLRRYTQQGKIRNTVRAADGKVLYDGSELRKLVYTKI